MAGLLSHPVFLLPLGRLTHTYSTVGPYLPAYAESVPHQQPMERRHTGTRGAAALLGNLPGLLDVLHQTAWLLVHLHRGYPHHVVRHVHLQPLQRLHPRRAHRPLCGWTLSAHRILEPLRSWLYGTAATHRNGRGPAAELEGRQPLSGRHPCCGCHHFRAEDVLPALHGRTSGGHLHCDAAYLPERQVYRRSQTGIVCRHCAGAAGLYPADESNLHHWKEKMGRRQIPCIRRHRHGSPACRLFPADQLQPLRRQELPDRAEDVPQARRLRLGRSTGSQPRVAGTAHPPDDYGPEYCPPPSRQHRQHDVQIRQPHHPTDRVDLQED